MAVSAPPETTVKVPRAPLGCPNAKLWLSKNNKSRQDPTGLALEIKLYLYFKVIIYYFNTSFC